MFGGILAHRVDGGFDSISFFRKPWSALSHHCFLPPRFLFGPFHYTYADAAVPPLRTEVWASSMQSDFEKLLKGGTSVQSDGDGAIAATKGANAQRMPPILLVECFCKTKARDSAAESVSWHLRLRYKIISSAAAKHLHPLVSIPRTRFLS